MKHVAVVGASKGAGLETAKALLGAGHQVCVFARSGQGIQLRDPKLEKVRGDVTNSQEIAPASIGIDVVIQTLWAPSATCFGRSRFLTQVPVVATDSRSEFLNVPK